MKPSTPGRVSANFVRPWARLTRRQRRALTALGMANLIALSVLVLLLLRVPPPSGDTLATSPLNPQHLEACRQQASRALLNAGQTGMVQTQEDGTILLQLQRSTTTSSLRLDADGAIWAALEAVAVVSQGDCMGFNTVQVTVLIQPPDHSPARATARVGLPDLLLWSLGEIDDAELALRLDYQPPTTHHP
jgi:hypothetical protein